MLPKGITADMLQNTTFQESETSSPLYGGVKTIRDFSLAGIKPARASISNLFDFSDIKPTYGSATQQPAPTPSPTTAFTPSIVAEIDYVKPKYTPVGYGDEGGIKPTPAPTPTPTGGSNVVEPNLGGGLPPKNVPVFDLDNPQGNLPTQGAGSTSGGASGGGTDAINVEEVAKKIQKTPYLLIGLVLVAGYLVFRKK